ncbi:hypothetical protein [Dyella sp. ASV21]|uniref:hypothetical protein n=1 Tax=Dyella sp. ASV21 TaxID=2795114 RepID=UPI0018EAFF1E|nr:hypothetical protein [Dyella sp. ASV21]
MDRTYRRKRVALTGLAFTALLTIAPVASASQIFGGNAFFDWQIVSAPLSGLSDITFPETFGALTQRTSGTYVAYQFNFKGQPDVGYIGIQPRPDKNGRAKLHAAFSSFISGTMSTDAEHCTNGAEGGPGVSCSVEFDAVYGHTYALKVSRVSADTWTGTVTDTVTGATTRIGTYALPPGSGLLKPTQTGFLDYYSASSSSCDSMQKIDVQLGLPTTSTGLMGKMGVPYEYGACAGKAGFSAKALPGGYRIQRGSVSPAQSLSPSIRVNGTTVIVTDNASVLSASNRIVVDVDGKQVMENYSGSTYGGTRSTAGTVTTISTTVPTIRAGSVVSVYLAPNLPGESRTDETLIRSLTYAGAGGPNISNGVHSIRVTGTDVNVDLDAAFAAGPNRVIVDVDATYTMENYAGTPYYSHSSTSGTTTTISTSVPTIKPGSYISVYLAPSKPSSPRTGQTLISSWTYASGVNAIRITGTDVNVDLDKAFAAGKNRVIVDVDGQYLMENYEGSAYYSYRSTVGATTTISGSAPTLKPGSVVSVYLAPYTPGSVRTGQTLLSTWTMR